MTLQAKRISDDSAVDYTPEAAVSAGDVVVVGAIVGVAPRAIAAGVLGCIEVEGVFEFPKSNAEAITGGAALYWDAANEQATMDDDDGASVPTAFVYIGKAVPAGAAETATTVQVRLNQ